MPTVIIMRGVPGSGKSSKVREFQIILDGLGLTHVVCSADHFRYVDGVYTFVSSREPHLKCFEKFKQEIDKGEADVVFVDNTNCTLRSMKPYVEYALQKECKVLLHSIQPTEDLEVYVKRNIHNVPRESIERMYRRWVPNPTVEEIMKSRSELS